MKSQNRLAASESRVSIKNLAVYIKFPDDETPPDVSLYDGIFPGLDDYYRAVTQNRINIDSVMPKEADGTMYMYTTPHNRDYYAHSINSQERYQKEYELISDIFRNIATKYDFTADEIDRIGPNESPDGYVDAVSILIIDSRTPTWGGILWPHRFNVRSLKGESADDPKMLGKWFGEYSLNFIDYLDIGTVCHEMGHVLGAPDYYHYQYDYSPVGEWDLMGDTTSTPQYMLTHTVNKYLKSVKPDEICEITKSGTYTAYATTVSRDSGIGALQPLAYKIPTKRPNEYIMVEMRTKTSGYDWVLPGTGLVVYRVIEDLRGSRKAIYGKSNKADEVFVYRPKVHNQPNIPASYSTYRSSFLDIKLGYLSVYNKYFNKVGKPLDINNRNIYESDAIYYSDGANTGIQIIALSTDSFYSQFRVILPDEEPTNIFDKFEMLNATLFEDEIGAGVKFSFAVNRGLDLSLLKNIQASLTSEGQSPFSVMNINIAKFKNDYNNNKSVFEGRFYLRETADPNNIFWYSKVRTGNAILEEEYPEYVSLVILDANNNCSVDKKIAINKDGKSWNKLSKSNPSISIYASDMMSAVLDKNGIARTNIPLGHTGDYHEDTLNSMWNIEGKGPYISLSLGMEHLLALRDDFTVEAYGQYRCLELNARRWSNVVKVVASFMASYGLTSSGKVLSLGDNTYGQMEVDSWTDIIDIVAYYDNVIGITRSGKVKVAGYFSADLKEVLEAETNVRQVGLAADYVVLLYRDGKVKAFGDIANINELNATLDSLSGIKKVSAADGYFSLLTNEGRVITPMGESESFKEQFNSLVDIVDLSCSNYHAMFLREDGAIEYIGGNDVYKTNVDFGKLVYTGIGEFKEVSNIEIIDSFGCSMPTTMQLDYDENNPKYSYLTMKTIAQGGENSTYKRLIYSTSLVEGHEDDVAEIQIDVESHPSTGNYALLAGQDVTKWKITTIKEGYLRLNIRANGTNISKAIDIEVRKFTPLEGILIEGAKLDIHGDPDLTKPSIFIKEYAADALEPPPFVQLNILKNLINAIGQESLPKPTYVVEPSGLVTINDSGQIRAVKGVNLTENSQCIITAKLAYKGVEYSTKTKVKIVPEIESISAVYPEEITVFDLRYGDTLPYEQMQIKVLCNIDDENVETLMGVSESMVDMDTFNPVELGDQQVKITYFDKSCYFAISIKDYITSIEVVNPKVRYKLETIAFDANAEIGIIKYQKASGGEKVSCSYIDMPFGGKFLTNLIQTDLYTLPGERTVELVYSNKIGSYLNQVRTTYQITVIDYITNIDFRENSVMANNGLFVEYQVDLEAYAIYLNFTFQSTSVMLVDLCKLSINGYDKNVLGAHEVTLSYIDEFGNEFSLEPKIVTVYLRFQQLDVNGWDVSHKNDSDKYFYYLKDGDLILDSVKFVANDMTFINVEREGESENQNIYYNYETNDVGEVAGKFNKSIVGKTLYVAINIYIKTKEGSSVVMKRHSTHYIATFGILRWEIMGLKEDGQFVSKGKEDNPLEFTYADYDRYPPLSLIALYFNPENEDEIGAYLNPLNISFDQNIVDAPQKLNIRFIGNSKSQTREGSNLIEQDYWIILRDKITITIKSSESTNGGVDVTKVEVRYGTKVSINFDILTIGTTNVKAIPASNTEKFTYVFLNWSGVSKTVIEDFTITANFDREYVNYIVAFYSEDGVTEILKKIDYHYGDLVTVPMAPVKAADKANTYEFAGWDKEVTNVVSNARYVARYKANPILYAFRILGGSVVGNNNIPTTIKDGDIITVTADPAPVGKKFEGWYVNGVLKSTDINYVYTFDGDVGDLDLESRYVDIVLEEVDGNSLTGDGHEGLSYGFIALIVVAGLVIIFVGGFITYWSFIIRRISMALRNYSKRSRK